MSQSSPNLSLPYIASAQAQKHITHNQALQALDGIVQLSVEGIRDVPPSAGTTDEGASFILGPDASGDWAGKSGHIVSLQNGQWISVTPQTGWRAWNTEAETLLVYKGSEWSSVPIERTDVLGVNASADNYNRLSVNAPASLFSHDGAGHNLVINKQSGEDTASLLFQSGFVGHAEMGLVGDNAFQIKVSSDGADFHTAMTVNALGRIHFPGGLYRGVDLKGPTETGASQSFYGFPNSLAVPLSRENVELDSGDIYISPIYVDSAHTLQSVTLAVYSAQSQSNALGRMALYHLGEGENNGWQLGTLIKDFGSFSAAQNGMKTLQVNPEMELSPGWYGLAVGVSGPDVKVRYVTYAMPRMAQFFLYETANTADFRTTGMSSCLVIKNHDDDITAGFAQTYNSGDMSMIRTHNYGARLYVMPKWKRS